MESRQRRGWMESRQPRFLRDQSRQAAGRRGLPLVSQSQRDSCGAVGSKGDIVDRLLIAEGWPVYPATGGAHLANDRPLFVPYLPAA